MLFGLGLRLDNLKPHKQKQRNTVLCKKILVFNSG